MIKKILLLIILSIYLNHPLSAQTIEHLQVDLFADLKTFEKINKIKFNKSVKCKTKYCKNKYEIRLDNPKYFTDYTIYTNDKDEIIYLSGIVLNRDSLETPDYFEKWVDLYKSTSCQTEQSWGVDYLSQKYKVDRQNFIRIFSEGKSKSSQEYENILLDQIILKLDNGKKIFELKCKYSRTANDKWIMSILYSTLMTDEFYEALEKIYPKTKLKKFDGYDIRSYLFPKSF